jgi:D-methionine transport system substrate-binding protein
MFRCLSLIATLFILLTGCSPKTGLKVMATAVPHAEMLNFIKPDLQAEGYDLIVIVTNDYNEPNRALVKNEIDANFFQTVPFMDAQIREFHYPIESIGAIEIEPMGVYSKKFKSIAELPDNGVIAVANDPIDQFRGLLLLQDQGLIQLSPTKQIGTIADVRSNPHNFRFITADPAALPRMLSDVAAATINTNFALQNDLDPTKDAIAIENKDSPWVNVLTIRTGDENRDDILALKRAMTSDKMKDFILQKYKGAVLPAF